MNRYHRLILFIFLLLVVLLYFPINQEVMGGRLLKSSLDKYVPFLPVFVYPYLFALFWWSACSIWAFSKMDQRRLITFIVAVIISSLTAYLIYIFFPTHVIRPEFENNGLSRILLGYVYEFDRPYNTFPSGHTYFTTLIFLFWQEWKPGQKTLWAIITVTILASTLFVHQHYIIDLIGGIGLAGIAFIISDFFVSDVKNDVSK
jgi:membrane-associated phospholipid phosphatase